MAKNTASYRQELLKINQEHYLEVLRKKQIEVKNYPHPLEMDNFYLQD
jgi:hypothetical protein